VTAQSRLERLVRSGTFCVTAEVVPPRSADGAAVRAHPLRVAFARHQEAAREVGAHHRLPALLRDVGERGGELAAGVVDEAIDVAVRLQDGGDRRGHSFLLTDVARVSGSLAAILGNLGGDRIELVRLAADQRHRGAQRGELMGRAAANPAASAGDDDHLTGE